MEIFIDNIIDAQFDFDYIDIARKVCAKALELEKCQFDCEINITITDDEDIKDINYQTRNIDRATDVLSFPNLSYEFPGVFDIPESEKLLALNPENDLIVLGDIILSYDRIISQASEYGHSVLREYAFLIAHSMLHLCGYDHMEEEEAKIMEEHQKNIMTALDINRD